jgi:hypothetical protein
MYIAALVFMGAILNHLEEISTDDVNNTKNTVFIGQVKAQYGTIEGTIWTLFASVTGGYDWAGPAETLMSWDPFTRGASCSTSPSPCLWC